MKRFFNFSVYKEQLRRLKMPAMLVGILTTFILIMIVVFYRVVGYSDLYTGANPTMLPMVFAPFFTVLLMEILIKDYRTRNGSDFYHALPVTRQSVMTSSVLAVLSVIVLYITIPTAIQAIVSYVMGVTRFDWDRFYSGVVFASLISIYFCGGLCLGYCLTGKRSSHMIVSAVIMFGPRLLLFFIALLIMEIMPYLLLNRLSLLFDPVKYNLVFSYMADKGPTTTAVVYTMLITLVYFVLAYILIVRRPSETAGSPTTSPKIETVVRIILSCALCLPSIAAIVFLMALDESSTYIYGGDLDLYVIVFFYLLSIIFYFLYEIIQTKKVKAAFKHWKGFGWVVVFNLLIILGISITFNNVTDKRPNADEIASVSIIEVSKGVFDEEERDYDPYPYNWDTPVFLDKKSEKIFEGLIYDIPLTSGRVRTAVSQELDLAISDPDAYRSRRHYISTKDFQNISGNTYALSDRRYVGLKIRLTNGKTIYRCLSLPINTFAEMIEKPEFTQRLDKIDLAKAIRLYEEQIDDGHVEVRLNTVSFSNVYINEGSRKYNKMIEDLIHALQEDVQAMTTEQKAKFIFSSVENIRTEDDFWKNTYKNKKIEAQLLSWLPCSSSFVFVGSKELTPSFFDAAMENELFQRTLQNWADRYYYFNLSEGGGANVSN